LLRHGVEFSGVAFMVLAVVELHDFGGDVGFEGVVGIGEVGEGDWGWGGKVLFVLSFEGHFSFLFFAIFLQFLSQFIAIYGNIFLK